MNKESKLPTTQDPKTAEDKGRCAPATLLADPPHEVLQILNRVMVGKTSCRRAWHDIDEIYATETVLERNALLKVISDMTQILRIAGAPLNNLGALSPLVEWAEATKRATEPCATPHVG